MHKNEVLITRYSKMVEFLENKKSNSNNHTEKLMLDNEIADFNTIIYALKRIEELEHTNKVLVDGVKAIDIYKVEYDENKYRYQSRLVYEEDKKRYTKIKAMLELVEEA